jgi:hypothetical protein
MIPRWYRTVFIVAAVYDAIIGAAFLVAWQRVFELFGVTPPNHGGYVQFPAALLMIFAAMFSRIARDPRAGRSLIRYGIALKVAYSALIFGYQFTTGVPAMWVPFAWLDVGFAFVFFLVWRALGTPRRAGVAVAPDRERRGIRGAAVAAKMGRTQEET